MRLVGETLLVQDTWNSESFSERTHDLIKFCRLLMFLIHSVQLNLTSRSIICFVSHQTKMKWIFFWVMCWCGVRWNIQLHRCVSLNVSEWVTLKTLWDRSDMVWGVAIFINELWCNVWYSTICASLYRSDILTHQSTGNEFVQHGDVKL